VKEWVKEWGQLVTAAAAGPLRKCAGEATYIEAEKVLAMYGKQTLQLSDQERQELSPEVSARLLLQRFRAQGNQRQESEA
jgi:hypothetical protein